jgi:hypothetical protein
MKLGAIVLAHRLPEQVAGLVSALRHPDLRLYLHVDARVSISPFLAALGGGLATNVTVLPRYAHIWGSTAIVDATLAGLASAVQEDCDHVVLLSGQDFPLRPAAEIVSFFEGAGDRSHVAHWELPTDRWRFGGRDRTDFYSYTILGRRETCIPRGEDVASLNLRGRSLNLLLRARTAPRPARVFPPYARPHGGWQWWNLSRTAARYVVDFVTRHPDYRRYHEHSLCASEIFFQSILLGTEFAREHEVVNDSLRYTVWREATNHPEVLTMADLPAMRDSGQLFARKFDSTVDQDVLTHLAQEVAG